jgi:fumarate reductase flavoprotein subunit
MVEITRSKTDILILGSGGAGLFAALHAHKADPDLSITIAVKGLLGKCGCTRMVQGGYNVAIADEDSVERHFMDTILGGKWLNHQEISWKLVNVAVERIHELENDMGCFFDRNPDGTIHQKAFAGQTFDRTVHKGSLTGIEIISRLAEQVWSRGIRRMEEHRAIALVPSKDGTRIAGVLMIDMQTGEFHLVQAKAVMIGTGGGPTMYKFHTPSGDKSCDGIAMALRAGLPLIDMEMVQFHPTGLVAGEDTRITGTIIEEGLRGAGGYLLDGSEQRFMHEFDERGERATRDIVSRAMYEMMKQGRTAPNGGLYITMAHLDPKMVVQQFKGMVDRCRDVGFDLVGGLVEVVPTAHYMMGGIKFDENCFTDIPGVFVAGEDAGGAHGANRLGGNGVANSTVFGGVAGDTMAPWVRRDGEFSDPDEAVVEETISRCLMPFSNNSGSVTDLRLRLYDLMWEEVGITRTAESLNRGLAGLDELENDLQSTHFRDDFPETRDLEASANTVVRREGDAISIDTSPVAFTRIKPGETLLAEDAAD